MEEKLLKDRIIHLNGDIDEEMSYKIISQLLYLEKQDPKKDITLYINSYGGDALQSLAIYDTMNYIQPNVNTIAVGITDEMATFILASGHKRTATPNCEIVVSPPQFATLGYSQAVDIEIDSKQIIAIRNKINKILPLMSRQRSRYFTVKEATNVGILC